MINLTLSSYQNAISAAFDHWLDQDTKSFQIQLEGHDVQVTIAKVDDRFNCGVPGYWLDNKNIPALKSWVPQNIKTNGYIGELSACRDGAVNVWLKGGVSVMFNFHVNLSNGCP